MLRSPLRYPGGKSRIVSEIEKYFPHNFDKYIEPMVGGGSMFIFISQKYPKKKIIINDINKNIYCFWKYVKEKNTELVDSIKEIKNKYKNGKNLYKFLKLKLINDKINDFDRAVYFYILNRISFSGLSLSGGYSHEAFKKRFTISSIEKISKLRNTMMNVEIYCKDYSEFLICNEKNVFIYLDPPYFSTKNSKLYGKNGDLHLNFDHKRLYDLVFSCKHKILITYDDSEHIYNLYKNSKNFRFFKINSKYSINNKYQSKLSKKKELVIINYNSFKNQDFTLISSDRIKY
ncbi:MAG: DNA adenine methylase [Candidatus Helarchaeota archaeon]